MKLSRGEVVSGIEVTSRDQYRAARISGPGDPENVNIIRVVEYKKPGVACKTLIALI
jgi:hypothetical protein